MKKIDFKKEFLDLYKVPANKITLIKVPKLQYLMIDGQGDPNNSTQFQEAVEALYSVSYTLKFMIKKGEQQVDYGVMPLEGLWWSDNMNEFSMEYKAQWKWTLMIMQPEFVSASMVELAISQTKKKKNLTNLNQLRLETMEEGLCAQLLYVGPYDAEPETIAGLHTYIKAEGYTLRGKHREIYLNDSRRTAPEKLKTIIRQPIVK